MQFSKQEQSAIFAIILFIFLLKLSLRYVGDIFVIVPQVEV